MEMYKQLKELLQDNHRKLAQLLRTASPPCVPYLGVFLSEIQQIEDGESVLVSLSEGGGGRGALLFGLQALPISLEAV
jgi:hypothetical protein